MERAPVAGDLLVARPELLDPNFACTVVLVCRHEAEEGTFGFVLTRPSGHTLGDVGGPFAEDRDEPLLVGGPVQPEALWVLHRRPDLGTEVERIVPGLWFGARPELVEALLRAPVPDVHGHLAIFLAGYAGWGRGQLEAEISEGAWDLVPALPDAYFGGERDDLWEDMVLRTRLPVARHPEQLLRSAES